MKPETSAAHFASELAREKVDAEALREAGEPDPEAAVASFLEAAREPDLAPSLPVWAPALLRSARPGFGAHCLAQLARASRESGGGRLDLADSPALPLLLGSSGFLARLLLRHPAWLAELRGAPPGAPASDPIDADWDAIREAKYRGLLRIIARDLLARPFEASLRELSDLADRCLSAGLACAARETEVEAPALLALGKLGGRELNFSSDVDLLFVYRNPPAVDALEHNHAVARLIRRLKTALEARSEDGFGYRVDLGLRPEADTGVLANPVEVALSYYETFGAEWERQMLIRLRPVAGPASVGAGFASEIAPFVYRRLIDPGVMRSVRDMKARIEDERRRAGRDLELDLKEGPGGIRDVEFLVQSLQLFFGGRDLALRTGNVLEALSALSRLRHLPEATAAALVSAYTWLRRAEHALQLAEEQQTARFPHERPAQIALARRMGYAEPRAETARAALLEDWTASRGEVRAHFDALVLRGAE
jgi:glutamate-ammonia-ligase adenylyltransferase